LSAINKKLSQGSSAIYSALLKYGYNNFSLDILEYCEPSVLINREQYYIDLLKPQYNILKIAENRLGSKHSEATIAQMSLNNTGINHPFFGKRHTDESRKTIGQSLKAIVRSKDKPKIITVETRLKLSLRSHGVCIKIFDESNNLVNEFPSITSAAKYFNISNRTVGRYLDKNTLYKGFMFKSFVKIK
jgi:group I intron endonuclease